MSRYQLAMGGPSMMARKVIDAARIGGIPENLEVIGRIVMGGGPVEEIGLEWFQLDSEAGVVDLARELKERGLERPTRQMAIQSAAIIPIEALQLGDVVFPHVTPVELWTGSHMVDCCIAIGLVQGTEKRQLILKLERNTWSAGTIFAGVVSQE